MPRLPPRLAAIIPALASLFMQQRTRRHAEAPLLGTPSAPGRRTATGILRRGLVGLVSITMAGALAPAMARAEGTTGSGGEASAPIPPTYFGLTVNHNESVPFPGLPFGAIRSWDATDVSWDNINKARGTYDWSGFDTWMSYVSGHGVDILYVFGRTPRWASSKPSAHALYGPGQCAPPMAMTDWDEFVRAVVKRAAGRIRYWELWNEPQGQGAYCGSVPQMVAMAQRAYAIIKAADPTLQVLTPATLYDNGAGPRWLDAYLAAGGTPYADIVSFHGYLNAPAEEHLEVIKDYQAVTRQNHVDALPLWNTESDWGDAVGAAGQAAYLAKYYLMQWGEGVSRFYWYSYDNDRFGTLYADGSLNQQGVAYEQVSRWMVGAAQREPCAEDARATWTCPFTRDGQPVLALWNSAGAVRLKAAPEYKRYRDLAGASHAISGEITLGDSPILLETEEP